MNIKTSAKHFFNAMRYRHKVISGVSYLSNRSTQPRSSTAVLLSSSHLAKGKGASTRRLVSGTHGGLLGMSDGIGVPTKNHFVSTTE